MDLLTLSRSPGDTNREGHISGNADEQLEAESGVALGQEAPWAILSGRPHLWILLPEKMELTTVSELIRPVPDVPGCR